ncbi:MAG: MDR family MFS transporter [Leuconostoc pseudomesenteroides]|uniref:MDR family MFS transporter n=1 Tax=Leuconostoc pseudomesenteroides TaxID=33968 RepID=UPI0039E8506B
MIDHRSIDTNDEMPLTEVKKIAWILVLGALAPMLDSTMANIAVNHLASDFKSGIDLIQWVITGYVLSMAVAVPFTGWLTNRFDGKKIFILSEILFLLGSIGSAIAPDLHMLIAARLLQGFSAGLITPLLTSLLMSLAGKNAGQLMATVGLPMVIGPILGPVIGALIIEYMSWRWIFWINVPVVIIALTLIWWKLPHFPARDEAAHLDFVGVMLTSSASAFLIYGITKAAKAANLLNYDTVVFAGIGLGLIIIYIIWAAYRKTAAVLPLSLFTHRSFNASSIGLFMVGLIVNGPMLVLPLFFQNGRHMTIVAAGLSLIPQGIGMLVARPMIGKLTDKLGARYVVMFSLVMSLIGTLPFAFFNATSSMVLITIVLFIRGIGVGGVFMPLMTDAFTGLEKGDIAQATIGTRIIQNVGGAFGSAIVATAMANSMQNALSGMKSKIAAGAYHVSAQQMPAHIKALTAGFQMDAYHLAFWIAIVVSLLAFIPAMFLTNKVGQK